MRRALFCSALIMLCIVLPIFMGCDGLRTSDQVNTKAPTDRLIGTWKFISLRGQSSQDDVLLPYGEHVYGMLMYDEKGNMSVLLMRPDRPEFVSGDMMKGTPEELKAAFEGFDAYCGTYTIDPVRSSVTHHLLGSKFPNWVGTDQVRYYSITNDTLRLKAPPILAGDVEWNFEGILVRL